MKKPILAAITAFTFSMSPIHVSAGPLKSELVTARVEITVPAKKALTVLTFSQPVDYDGHRGFVSVQRGEAVVGPVLLSYPVNNGSTPPLIKDLTIGGPATVVVDPPDIEGGNAFFSYKLQSN